METPQGLHHDQEAVLRADEVALRDRALRQCRLWTAAFWAMALLDVALAVLTRRTWPHPAHVPIHDGPHGVDNWGSANGLLAVDLAGVAIMVVCGPVLGRLMPRVPMDMANVPHPEYWKTPARWPVSLTIIRAFLMATIASAMMLVCASQWGFLQLARGKSYPEELFWGCLAVLGLVVTIGTVALYRAHRPPSWWTPPA